MREGGGAERVLSWRGVFRTAWRIPRFMGFDLTRFTPGGPSVRFVGFLVVGFVLAALMHAAGITLGLPLIARWALLPVGVAWLASRNAPDGRHPLHVAMTLVLAQVQACWSWIVDQHAPVELQAEAAVTREGER